MLSDYICRCDTILYRVKVYRRWLHRVILEFYKYNYQNTVKKKNSFDERFYQIATETGLSANTVYKVYIKCSIK